MCSKTSFFLILNFPDLFRKLLYREIDLTSRHDKVQERVHPVNLNVQNSKQISLNALQIDLT